VTQVTERNKSTNSRDRRVSRDHRDQLIARNYELWNQSTGGVTGLTGGGAVLRYPARDEMRARCLAEELPANCQAGASHDAAALDHDRACHCRDCQHLRRIHEDSHIRQAGARTDNFCQPV
jgi:hypothetical protein